MDETKNGRDAECSAIPIRSILVAYMFGFKYIFQNFTFLPFYWFFVTLVENDRRKPIKPVSCIDGLYPFVFHSCINEDKCTCHRCYTNRKQPTATIPETKNKKNILNSNCFISDSEVFPLFSLYPVGMMMCL